MIKKRGYKAISLFLGIMVILGSSPQTMSVRAAEKTITLEDAKKLALAGSESYQKIQNKISLKEVSYEQAVKSIQLKIKNKTTFRWSPLLSFKFPEQLTFEDESEMVYKPASLQTELKQLKHQLSDEVYRVYEEVAQSFLKCYTYQQKVEFEEKQVENLEKTLEKNKSRLLIGLATRSDVESMETNLKSAKEKLTQDLKNYENAKEKLGDLIALDVNTGYEFENPYVTAEIPREELEHLILYTLDNDQSYYEAKMESQLSLLLLTENYSLLKKQYGSDINMISSYVEQVKNGQRIDGNAFKTSYDAFLKKIDDPWQGSWKILFIKIPKEWLKGSIDGVRYIEDEPYVLYENALEYQDLLSEQESVKKELVTQVKDSYESLMTAAASYLKLEEQCAEAEKKLEKEKILNAIGELSYEEYSDSKNQYESMQIESLEALELYSSLVFSLDRLTCGAVSEYFTESNVSLTEQDGGSSYVVEEEKTEGAKYYIEALVEDNMFEIGIYIPKDIASDITHYELWVDHYVIGEKIEISETLRHLTLSLTGEERVFIRLYSGDEFIDDCEIEPSSYQGELEITSYKLSEAKEEGARVIGTYETKVNETTGMMKLSVKIDSGENIHFYGLQNEEGKYLISEEVKTPVKESFTYMGFAEADLEHLQLVCFDKEKQEVYISYFDMDKNELYIMEE